MSAYKLFDTPIGRCAIVWGEHGVRGLMLPVHDDDRLRAHVRRRHEPAVEAAPPANVQQVIDDIVALLHGAPRDLLHIQLDMDSIAPFERRVYDAARRIAPGATSTYGEIASQLGEPGAARAVGHALGRNPYAIIVPCHRVLAAGGRAGGFSAPGGLATKLRLLTIEGALDDGLFAS